MTDADYKAYMEKYKWLHELSTTDPDGCHLFQCYACCHAAANSGVMARPYGEPWRWVGVGNPWTLPEGVRLVDDSQLKGHEDSEAHKEAQDKARQVRGHGNVQASKLAAKAIGSDMYSDSR